MSKKTIALVTGLVLLTVVLVVLALKMTNPAPQKQPEAQPTPSLAAQAKTVLALTPNPVTLTGNSASVEVTMDSADNEVTAVQMELSYDPKVLAFVSVTPSSEFTNAVALINNVDKKNGRISYALGLSPEQAKTPHTGKTNVATIVFTKIGSATQSATTEVKFLPKSLVSARGINQSVLKETQGTTINLGQ